MNDTNEILMEMRTHRKEIEAENGNDLEAIYKKYLAQQTINPADYVVGKPAPLVNLKAA